MKPILIIPSLLLILAFVCLPTNAQSSEGDSRPYAKDGLAFQYPVGWVITDQSTAEAQRLIISRAGSSVLIMIVALRDLVSDRRQLDSVRKGFTQPLIEGIAKKFGVSGSDAPRESLCVDVSGKKASGVRVKGIYDKQPSTGEVYSFSMGLRFVTLAYVIADKDGAQGDVAWRAIRESFKIDRSAAVAGKTELGPEGFLSLGVLNGKALVLARPEYPSFARSAHASGTVAVEVTIDETGRVVAGRAVSGHQMLREASVEAARRAKFSPTLLCGEAVKVTGIITYSFLPY